MKSAISLLASLLLCVLLVGCETSRLNKHANAFSTALAPVVDQSTAAYRDAVALHNIREDYEAVVAFRNKDDKYDPRKAPKLLTEKDLQVRLAALAALQLYAKSLIQITQSTDSSELDAASKSVGSNLTSLGNDLAPSIESVLGVSAAEPETTTTTTTTSSGSTSTTTSSRSTSTPTVLSPEVRNGISTAVNALGQFFVNRLIEKELPGQVEKMNPQIQTFCTALKHDITVLDSIGQRDDNRILNLEKEFILEDEASPNLDHQAWRAEVMRLPEIARQQQEAHERLLALHDALNKLALTHQALAAEAEHDNPETLKEKLSELSDIGSALGKFYSSLPTN